MSGKNLSRRDALGVFVIGMLSLPRPARALLFGRGCAESLIVDRLSSCFDTDAAAAVGSRYLETTPSEANIRTLAQLICPPGTTRYVKLAAMAPTEMTSLVDDWQKDDFEHERIVGVSGWLFSQTEARICALTALVRTRQLSENPDSGCVRASSAPISEIRA